MKKPIPVDKFLFIVTRLSNTCFVRHWMKWEGVGEPYRLAFCLHDWEGRCQMPYQGDIEEWDYVTQQIGADTVFVFRPDL